MFKIEFSQGNRTSDGFSGAAELMRERGAALPENCMRPDACLRSLPLPFADGEVDAVRISCSADALTDDESFVRFFCELYRVCRDDATIELVSLTSPYLNALELPFPLRPVTASRLAVLDAEKRAGLDFPVDLDCNIRTLSVTAGLSPAFIEENRGKSISAAELHAAVSASPAVVRTLNFTLSVRRS